MCHPLDIVAPLIRPLANILGLSPQAQPGVAQPVAAPAAAAAPVGQAAQQPDQAALRGAAGTGNAGAASAGSTLLTGGKGVAPSLLTLGKNTLLGA